MNRCVSWLAAAVLVVTAMGAASAETRTVTDMVGRTVTIPSAPQRIVCLGPGALRLIVYLQATDLVAGVEELEKSSLGGRPYALAHPELARLPGVGPGGPAGINQKPAMEAVLSVQPQVVFVTYMEAPLADEVQQTLGVPVVVLSYGRFATFDEVLLDSILVAGKVLNRDARAREIVDFIGALRKELQDRTQGIAPERRPRAYVGGVGHRGAHGIESTEQNYIPMRWVNADNVAESVEARLGSHVFMDKERLLALDPEVIFLDGGGLNLIIEDYEKKPTFYQALQAFKNRRIYTLLPFNSYTTNIETALADAFAVGKVLYPERFADIDPEVKVNEIYAFFVGSPVYETMRNTYGPIGGAAPFWKENQTPASQ